MKVVFRQSFNQFQRLCFLLLSAMAFMSLDGRAQITEDSQSAEVLKKLSLEELLNMEVTSVSKREEKLSEVPSAIQVITQENIRRSGATSIPEALRLAGNLHIAQKNSSSWAISARGFNTDLANKMLVLIDGRTVYTPLFSGVFWDRQDYLLEDIERIEVISGPGGTLWGSNAVNGVINIITKSSQDTQGLYAEAGGGTELRYFTGLRYGGMLGPKTSFRVYGKYADRDKTFFPNAEDASDAWRIGQTGFSMETRSSEKNTFTLQGDYYDGLADMPTGGETDVWGANFLARWSHTFSANSDMRLQLYYDKTSLAQEVPQSMSADNAIVFAPAGTLGDDLDTYDVDFQHRLQLGQQNQLVWGFGFRYTHDEVENAPGLAFSPTTLDRNLINVFAQDKVALAENFFFTIGTKVEHNDYTGFEFEPSARLQLNITDKQTIWGAVSRAVRMPSRIDRHIRLPTPGFAPIVENLLVGGADFESETLVAYELGYRFQLASSVSGSIATFYNVYDEVRSTSLGPPDPVFGLPFPLFYKNDLEGEAYGFETAIAYTVFDWWRLHAAYNLFQADIRIKPDGQDFNNALNETADPKHRFSLRSSMNFLRNMELDAGLRWVDSFVYNNAGQPAEVDAYAELQVRLGWHITNKIELSVTGQNLLNDRHLEYVASSPNPRAEIQRGVYGKLAFQF